MSQISRPFQIALVAIVALALVWLVFLRGHSSSSESSSSTASSSAQPATAAKPSASSASGSSSAGAGGSAGSKAGSTPYHGSAPGVAGLTRAIAKARGAVAQSQREAKAQAGSSASQGASSSGSTHSSQAGSQSSSRGAAAPSAKAAPGESSSAKVNGAPVQEAAVQAQLKAGRTVIILFWSPSGADDKAVHLELQLLNAIDKKFGRKANKQIAVHYAHANEVGQFGSITRSLQILQTPTTLVISPSGNTKTLTGLTDAYAIQQAIGEARHP